MIYKLLDTVVLDRDLPEHGLRNGDLGAVVQVYEPDGVEVEFVTASGKTQALVTLNVNDVGPVQDSDLIAVRSVRKCVASIYANDRITSGFRWTAGKQQLFLTVSYERSILSSSMS
jgi:hypothetical protein